MGIRWVALFALLGGLGTSMGRRAPSPSTAGVPLPDPAAIQTCRADPNWVRPTPDQMAATVWQDPRYIDVATGEVLPYALAYYEGHFLFFTTPSPSGVEHALDMTGLFTAGIGPDELCGANGGPGEAALIAGREVVIWAIGYAIVTGELAGDTLTLAVEANASPEQGYAIVQVPWPQAEPWVVRFVLPDGTEIARAISPMSICCAEEHAPSATAPAAAVMPLPLQSPRADQAQRRVRERAVFGREAQASLRLIHNPQLPLPQPGLPS